MNKERLQALVAEGLPGAVAVGPDFAGAAGVANIETGEPLTTEHRFRNDSVTKIFLGALVLELVAEGTFNLGTPCKAHLTESAASRKVRPTIAARVSAHRTTRTAKTPSARGGAVSRFSEALNDQIAAEFAASQQYVAIAVHYDAQTLPTLAAHFYRQAVEERNHAMMIVQYLLDANLDAQIPGVEAPRTSFEDDRAPVALALEQEKAVTEQIARLVEIAREEHDHVGEHFLGWFLDEQREEVASMTSLLAVIDRATTTNMLLVEDYLARIGPSASEPSSPSPAAAGGML